MRTSATPCTRWVRCCMKPKCFFLDVALVPLIVCKYGYLNHHLCGAKKVSKIEMSNEHKLLMIPQGSFINYFTRDAACFRPKFTPTPSSPFRCAQRFSDLPAWRCFCQLSVYFGPTARSFFPALGPRHARNALGFTPLPLSRVT